VGKNQASIRITYLQIPAQKSEEIGFRFFKDIASEILK
jgi:hypothetical protein